MRLIGFAVCGVLALALARPAGVVAGSSHKTKVVCVNGAGNKVYRATPKSCTFHKRGEPMAEAFFVRTRHDHWHKWTRSHARGRGRERAPMGHSTTRVRIRLSARTHVCGHHVFSKAHFFFPSTGHGATMKLDVCA